MRHFRDFMLIGCALAAGCATGKVNVDTADQTPPELSLNVTALDPNTQMVKSVTVTTAGQGFDLDALENSEIIIVVSAKDSGGIKAIRMWNVGANLIDMSRGRVRRNTKFSLSECLKAGRYEGGARA